MVSSLDTKNQRAEALPREGVGELRQGGTQRNVVGKVEELPTKV